RRHISARRPLSTPHALTASHGADEVMPLGVFGWNRAAPICEFGMTYLIQKDQHIDRDQCVIHNRRCPPLRIVITDREEKHHVSIADRGLRIQEILLTFSAIYDSDCRLGADKSAIRNQRAPHFNFVLRTSK